MGDFEPDFDAVAAIESIIHPETAAPAADAAPATETPTEIQPQAAPEAGQTNDGVSTSEEAQAPVGESAAPAAAEAPKLQPEAPKAEQRLSPEPSAAPEPIAALNQTLHNINSLVQSLQADAVSKFSDLKSEADVLALMQTDPQRYNEFVIAQTKMTRALQAQQIAQTEAQKAYMSGEQKRLIAAIPELADPEKGDALKAKLRAYAKSQGIPDNRQARSADEVISLHREMVLAEKVQAYESEKAAQAAKLAEANKKAAVAPPVQKPGAQRDVNKDDKASSDFSRFQKSGRLDDLATALQHIL